jgi:hypothetical protein
MSTKTNNNVTDNNILIYNKLISIYNKYKDTDIKWRDPYGSIVVDINDPKSLSLLKAIYGDDNDTSKGE